jgi:radical SAM superfamily enzyme YgiQ (UPF0313 family)
MPAIVLSTLNAKYIHAAFGLRYLLANLGPLRPSAAIAEFDINQRPLDIAEALLARAPKIIGFGVYIWNVTQTAQVVALLKRVNPRLLIILGGPEVSHETLDQPIVDLADYVVTGEADLRFAELCGELMAGETPSGKILSAALPDFSQLVLPYDLYDEQDVAHRVVYVEASRGCPFSCEFCLSSLDIPVRQVPLPALLEQLQALLDRGLKQFKFVDRTFNLNLAVSRALLEFFLERHRPGQFYHFEMVPDRLPAALREVIARFPPGALQFEVGVQTFNQEVAELISRRQNYQRLEENLRFLKSSTAVHVHADLIAGLPGESLESFAAGFDRLVGLEPQEIQVGILKRLRGTPISRHDSTWQMVYDPNPPYEILQNRLMDFSTLHVLRRFARYWDLVANSGNFPETAPLIWADTREATAAAPSPFYSFLRFARWLHDRVGRTDGIALVRLMHLLFEFLTKELGLPLQDTARSLWRDYQRSGRRDKPAFLKDFLDRAEPVPAERNSRLWPKRQARHMLAAKAGLRNA